MTNNAIEFRGRYRKIALHPGVVFLLPAARRDAQLRLFVAALDHVRERPDLVNTALDVTFDQAGAPVVLSTLCRSSRSVSAALTTA